MGTAGDGRQATGDGPVLWLPEDLRAELLVYAREALPDEACGLLLGTGAHEARCQAVRPARNLHPGCAERFLLDPSAYAKAEKYCRKRAARGFRILGFWHSHPRGPAEPSALDLEEALGLHVSFPERYLYLILSLRIPERAALGCWRLEEKGGAFERVKLA